MNSMDKPPSLSERERQIIKSKCNLYNLHPLKLTPFTERKEEIEKRQAEEKEQLKRFKERVEKKFETHFNDPANNMLKFDPMNQIYRSIV